MKTFTIALLVALMALVSFGQTVPRGPGGAMPFTTSNVAADNATLANSGIVGLLTGTPTAAAAYTTPTAAAICSYFRNIVPGKPVSPNYNWDLYIKNTSGGANTITFTAGSGVTVTGTATIAQNAVKHFVGILTNCSSGAEAVTFLSLGSATF